ncbi:MAG TPA: low molecular weight protein-tyrosine-phosphatase [Fluviicola sp.]|nr:low molecular weight protein-tyrosine-phosphatase [Fluviicola sp.]
MRILMVCLGNICRSPMADGWLRHRILEKGLPIEVDSAGTANYHIGKQPDSRMRKFARETGVSIDDLRARQFVVDDFDRFDRIFVMDKSNYNNVIRLARNEADKAKVALYLNELFPGEDREVPDPYYGDDHDFKHVIELLDNTTNAFLRNAGYNL